MPNTAIETNKSTRVRDFNNALNRGVPTSPIRLMLNALHPAEIAHIIESLTPDKREIIWELVDPEFEGDVLLHVGDEVRASLIKKMETEDIISATEGMDLDDLADFMQDVPSSVYKAIIQSMDDQSRLRLETVMSFPEDTAGGLMNTDTIAIRPDVTLDVVMRYLRRQNEKIPENTDSLIVVDHHNKYLGTLSLADLVSNDPTLRVSEVYKQEPEGITATMQETQVAHIFTDHDLISAPVVNEQGILLGRITIDDVVDVIRDDAEHSLMSMAGLDEDNDMFAPVISSSMRRAVWLGVNLLTALMASAVIGVFEATLEKVVALAVLMPIVASMGGIAGSQTLTLVIRGLALGQIGFTNAKSLLIKEIAVSLLNGALWSIIVGCISIFWFGDIILGLIIGAAIIINLIIGAVSGIGIPLLLKQLHIDPALAGGVVLTTITDVIGFLAFLGLATIILI
ncbi:MAG: magnesium transporter [Gammaproteobacteria bacterium]|nr:MAG: magnesium transporter [Gammaproteobacteria bacterium]